MRLLRMRGPSLGAAESHTGAGSGALLQKDLGCQLFDPLVLNMIHNLYESTAFQNFRKSPDFYSRHQAILEVVLIKGDDLIGQRCCLHIRSGSQEGKLL